MEFIRKAHALTESDLGIEPTVGSVGNLYDIFSYFLNLLSYISYTLIFIGLAYSFMLLIRKLATVDSEEANTEFVNGLKKAVVIVVLGLLSISLGFLVKFVSGLFGLEGVEFAIPTIFE